MLREPLRILRMYQHVQLSSWLAPFSLKHSLSPSPTVISLDSLKIRLGPPCSVNGWGCPVELGYNAKSQAASWGLGQHKISGVRSENLGRAVGAAAGEKEDCQAPRRGPWRKATPFCYQGPGSLHALGIGYWGTVLLRGFLGP